MRFTDPAITPPSQKRPQIGLDGRSPVGAQGNAGVRCFGRPVYSRLVCNGRYRIRTSDLFGVREIVDAGIENGGSSAGPTERVTVQKVVCFYPLPVLSDKGQKNTMRKGII